MDEHRTNIPRELIIAASFLQGVHHTAGKGWPVINKVSSTFSAPSGAVATIAFKSCDILGHPYGTVFHVAGSTIDLKHDFLMEICSLVARGNLIPSGGDFVRVTMSLFGQTARKAAFLEKAALDAKRQADAKTLRDVLLKIKLNRTDAWANADALVDWIRAEASE